jgi:hypothetical protein
MKRLIFLGIVLSAATSAIAGCGDDEEDGDDDASGGGSNVSCDPNGDGTCQNEQDCPSVTSGDARESAQLCGQGCLQDPDPGMCAVGCIVMETGMTTGCSACYAGVVGCAFDNCLDQCNPNAASEECTQCQIDAGCRADFDACSGLTTPM